MTTPEDRLRQILLAEAADLIPAGDGLRRIEQRLAERRSLRSKLVPAVAIAGVVVVAGAAALTVSLTDKGSLDQHPPPAQHGPSAAPTTCAGGLCEEPKPSPTLSTTGVTTTASGIPLWPVTTDAQAAYWQRLSNTPRWESDPVQVTQHLMDDYLKLPGKAALFNDSGDVAVVTVSAGGRTVSTVRLVRVGRDANGPWAVTGATSVVLAVTQPQDGDEVSSPMSTAGTVNDVDQSVHLRLMSDRLLSEAFQPAGRDLPWTHSLSWTGTDWSVAALVANTFNGKGDLSAVSITAVRRSGALTPGLPAAGTAFVAVEKGHVVTVDAATGQQLRQISYPEGVIDSSPDRGGEDGVVWVRTQADGCTSSLLRVGLGRGAAGVTVLADPILRSLPALSEGGRSLGWVETPCGGGPSTVIVRGPDAKFSTTATSPTPIDELDVRDDGYAVVRLGSKVVILPPGVTTVQAGHVLVPAPGCLLAAPAWNGDVLLAWQKCARGWLIGRWAASGSALTAASDVVSGMSAPVHMAADSGHLLVVLADHRIAEALPNRLIDVPNASRWGEPDW